jgi:hypothetical protein
MPCTPLKLGDGVTALICSRGRTRKRCRYCSGAGGRLCDFPVTRDGVRGTCDAPLCSRCTTKIAGDGDLCRAHAPLWDAALGRPKVGPGAAEPAPSDQGGAA